MSTPSKFEVVAGEIGSLVTKKDEAYGRSFERSGDVMRALYPNGISPEQYVDALGTVRVVDKLFRIANKKHAFGESPWRDIAGYGVLGATRDELAYAPADPLADIFEHAKPGLKKARPRARK